MKFTIYASDGTTIKGYGCPTFNSTYLKVPYLEFREISSTNAIAWAVGDQVTYNNVVYRLYDIPQVTRNGQSDRTQGGTFQGRIGNTFVYQNVQFYPYLHELELLPFMDIVKKDNKIHFSTQDNVSTFENLSGIKDRIQANIDEVYGSGWTVQIVNSALLSADDQAKIAEAREFSVSGGSILDALNKIYEVWENIGWLYDGSKTITIGAANVADKSSISTEKFKQGKGKGLVTLQESQANKDEFGTRLYAYGSSRNINFQYYKSDSTILNAESLDINNLMIPKTSWGQTEGKYDPAKCYIQNAGKVAANGLRPKIHYFDGSEDEEVYPTIEGMTIGDVRNALDAIGQTIYKPSATAYPDATARVDVFRAVTNPSDNGDATKGTSFVIEGKTTETYTGGLSSLARNVETAVTNTASETGAMTFIAGASKEYTITADIKVVAMVGSADAIASGIITPSIKANIHQGAEVECKYTIDSNDRGLVHITCTKDLTAGQGLDFVLYLKANTNISQSINVSGSGVMTGGYDKNLDTTFSVSMRQVGFNIADRQALGSQGLATIFMNGGSCAGRSFVVKECLYDPANDAWNLTLIRAYDESIGMVYPNTTYPITTADKFVLLDIAMPDSYIKVAETRLLAKANALYSKISTRQVCYTPAIDSMHNSSALASLKAGWYMKLQDNVLIGYDATIAGDDKDIVKLVQIDSVSITETDKLPSYRITLREEKSTSFKKGIASTSSSTPWITSSSSASSSSEGGTTDYTELENKPSVNGVVLVGNKTASDLGLATSAELTAEATARANADSALSDAIADKANKLDVEQNRRDIASIDVDNLGDVHTRSIDMDSLPKVSGFDMYKFGYGAPTGLIPEFVGQFYIDKTNGKFYTSASLDGFSRPAEANANEIVTGNWEFRGNLIIDFETTYMPNGVTSLADRLNDKYEKPSGGIPSTDMANAVQTSLQNADSAVQPEDLATVATSGSYTDLTNKPSIPSPANDGKITIKKNGTKVDDFTVNQSANKDIDIAVPTKTSDLTNDSNFYAKPASGIPSTDMTSAVQTSLGKADTAYQKDANGIPKTDLASGVQTSLGKADTALQASALNPYRTATAQDAIDLGLSQAIGQVDDKLGNCTTANPAADKAFVNSSIATNTAIFKGTLDAYTDLGLTKPAAHSAIATALNAHTFTPAPTNNDYCFVINADNDSDVIYDRFKATANGSVISWAYEYSLNNSSFTATQWEAINSGVNSNKVFGYDAHLLDTQNPHGVNKEQVGLGNVPNTDFTQTIANMSVAIESKASTSALTSHTSDTTNPHGVTKAQIGLGSVPNTDFTQPVANLSVAVEAKEDHTNKVASWQSTPDNTHYPSEKLVKDSLDAKATTAALTSHTGNTSNPHNVTKAQVGLGNVDNTSDLNKPISTATQEALDRKADNEQVEANRRDIASIDVENMGDARAKSIDMDSLPKVCGFDMFKIGNGAPTGLIPEFVGQFYIDKTNGKFYTSSSLTGFSLAPDITADETITGNWVFSTGLRVGANKLHIGDAADTLESLLNAKQDTGNIRTSWQGTPDNTHYPSEKLVKDSLDTIADDLDEEAQTRQSQITNITNLIPSQATSSNKLADKEFVNSSISTSTATFRGTVTAANNTEEASQAALATITTKDLNDYANVLVQNTPSTGLNLYKRYTFNGAAWIFNFDINSTAFTATQWGAINSGVSSDLVGKTVTTDGTQTITGVKTFSGNDAKLRIDFSKIKTYDGGAEGESLSQVLGTKENESNKASSLTSPNDTKYPTTKAVSDALSLKANSADVTSALNLKENTSNKATSFANPDNTKYPTTKAVEDAFYNKGYMDGLLLEKVGTQEFNSHLLASNPHNITKATVGLGNVPNKDFTNEITDANNGIETNRRDIASVNVDNLGDARARSMDFDSLPKVCGFDMYKFGSGAPTELVPEFIGQVYIDITNHKYYTANNANSFYAVASTTGEEYFADGLRVYANKLHIGADTTTLEDVLIDRRTPTVQRQGQSQENVVSSPTVQRIQVVTGSILSPADANTLYIVI